MKIAAVFRFLLIVLFFFGCRPKHTTALFQQDDFSKYQSYIAEVSQGMVSTKADVRVVMNEPVTGWANGDELDSDLLNVTPNVKGKVVALNERTLSFVPENGFKQDTEYQFVLELKSILPDVPQGLGTFSFGVKTFKQQFNVYADALQSYSKEHQYLNGQVRTADIISLQTIKQLVTANHNGKNLGLKFDSSVIEGTQFQFKIDSIPRLEEDSALEIVWNGDKFNIESSGKNSIKVAGKNNFTIMDVSVETDGDQVLLINFSDPLKKDQNFKGLVVLQNASQPKFTVTGNTLKMYLAEDLDGVLDLEVFEGIQSEDGHKLKTKYETRVAFEQLAPQVRLLSNGTILPSSSNLKINFETVNLNAVDVSVFKIYQNNILQFLQANALGGNYNLKMVARPVANKKIAIDNQLSNANGKWSAHALDLSTLISPEKGAMYRVEFNYRPSYSVFKCETTNFGEEEATQENLNEEEEHSSWDGVEEYYDEYGYYGYEWSERENPCHRSYYYDKTIGINVLATDLGVTIKKGANSSYFVAVNDILTTLPLAGTKITFYNFQQQPLGHVVTGADGTAIFDSNLLAYFAVAELNAQKNYVKLNDGNTLSVSKFNVSGEVLQKGIKGFIFGERGIWRPGDQIFLSFMLNDNANPLPEGHPVKLELFDPYNKVAHRQTTSTAIDNFYQFNVATSENAPTGNWLAKVTVGGASFTKTLKIETIKPNRLKIKTEFDTDILGAASPVQGQMQVAWLHGAVAKNLKADITARFDRTNTTFKNFPGYVFDDPTRSFAIDDQVVFDGRINDEGKAHFSMTPQLKSKAPGMLNAAFITKVYENGGDFSSDVFTKTYSPYLTYIGLNLPKGDMARGMLLTDVKHRFEVVSVDGQGNPKAAKNLKVSIFKVDWRWWWDTSAENLSSYSASEYRELVFDKAISTNVSGEASFEFELKYPDWGRYLVLVEDTNGGHATGKAIYIDWPGWAGKSRKGDPSAATMLIFSTDKEKYSVGETATVTFPSSSGGRALVTVENGSEVLESLWVETTAGETMFKLPITHRYTPNVYINIASLQPHANTINSSPIRMYGIVGIGVENKNTKLEPTLSMPEVLRPEETITLKVGEKNKKSMAYSIAIVDEGLLDLTRFKTPDPWNSFYAKEALGVKTWDVYDDVIGAFGGKIDQVFAIGGDGELAGAKNKKANRFAPMVVHLGPFQLKEGETKSHTIKIPKYVGSVRTMVVAADSRSEAYGLAEKNTPVRKPLMVLASLPRKLTPGESVTLPVTVFAMEKKVKNVTLKIKKDPSFTVEGDATQVLTFDLPDEKMAYFQLKVADFKGIGKVMVEASGGGETASFEIPIDIVNPNPITGAVTQILLDANASQTVSLQTFGIAGSNTAEIEFSTLPHMNFNGRMAYLIQYPHGCLEQTTSAAFPQLYLADIFEIDGTKKKSIQNNIERAIKSLGGFQRPNGGFSYWPGLSEMDDWGSSYVGHFLLEAEKKGYVLPIGFKSSWIKQQQNLAKEWRSATNNPDLAQAYRLYTLALSGNADMASMNRLRETKGLSDPAKFRLAASYGLVGQANVAKQIVSNAKPEVENDKTYDFTYGSTERNNAMALETYVLLNDKAKAQELAKTIAKQLADKQWMSTQSTAYCLLAMAKFAAFIGGKEIKASYVINGKTIAVNSPKALDSRALEVKDGNNTLQIKNIGDNTVFVSIVNRGILPVGEERIDQKNLVAQVNYKGRDGSRLNVGQLVQGTDFVAEVILTNTSANNLTNVALTEIFPSGWEIVNTRFTDFGDFAQNDVSYTDLKDDRANFYFDMKAKETKTIRILLNASYLGRYYLPGVQAEAMYDNAYLVRTQGQWVEVLQE